MGENKLEQLFSNRGNTRMFTPMSTTELAYEIGNPTNFVDVGYDFIDWSTDAVHDFYRSVQKGEMDESLDMALVAKQNEEDASVLLNFMNGEGEENDANNALSNLKRNGVWTQNTNPTSNDLKNIIDTSQKEYEEAYNDYQHNLSQYNEDVKNYDISQYYTHKSNEAVMSMGNFFYKMPATMGTSNTSPVWQMSSMAAGFAGAKGGAAAGAAIGAPFGPIGIAAGTVIGGVLGSVGGAQLFGGVQSRELESHMEAFAGYRERALQNMNKQGVDLTKVANNVRQQLIQMGDDVSKYTDDMLIDQALVNPNIKSGDSLFNEIAKDSYKGSRVLYEKNNALGFGEALSDLTYFIPVGKWISKGLGAIGGKIAKVTKLDKMLAKRTAAGADVALRSLSNLSDDAARAVRKQKAWDFVKRVGFNSLVEGSEEGAQSILSNEYVNGKFDDENANATLTDAVLSGEAFTDVAQNVYRRARAVTAVFTPFDPEYSDDRQLMEEFFVGMLLPFTSPQAMLGNIASIHDAHKAITNTKKFSEAYANALASQDATDRKVDFIKNLRENKLALRNYGEVLDNIGNTLKSGKYDTSVLTDDGSQLSEQDVDTFIKDQKEQYLRINNLAKRNESKLDEWGFVDEERDIYLALLDDANMNYIDADNETRKANAATAMVFYSNAQQDDFKSSVSDLNGIPTDAPSSVYERMSTISEINHRIQELNSAIDGYQLQSTAQANAKKKGIVDSTNVLQISKLQKDALRTVQMLEETRENLVKQLKNEYENIDVDQVREFDEISENIAERALNAVQQLVLNSLDAEYARNARDGFKDKSISVERIAKYKNRVKRQHKLADQANEVARTGTASDGTKQAVNTDIQSLNQEELIAKREETKQNLKNELTSLEETLSQIPQGSILRNYADTILNGRRLYQSDEEFVQYIENASAQLSNKYSKKSQSDELSEEDKVQLKALSNTVDNLSNYAKQIRDSISEEQARARRHRAGFDASNRVYSDNDGKRYQFKMQEAEYSENEGLVLKMINLDDTSKSAEHDKIIKDLEALKSGLEDRKQREGKNQDYYDKLIDRVNKQIEAAKVDRDTYVDTVEVPVKGNEDFLRSLVTRNNKGEEVPFSTDLDRKLRSIDNKIQKDIENRKKMKEQASIVGDVVEDNKSEASTPKWTITEEENKEDRELKTLSYPIGNDERTKSIFTNSYHQSKYWYGEITMPYSNDLELLDRLTYRDAEGQLVDNTQGETNGKKWSRLDAMRTFHALGKAIEGMKRSEVIDVLTQLMDGKNVKIGNKTFKASDYDNMINVLPLITRLRQNRLNNRPFILVHPDLGSVGRLEKFSKNEKKERTRLINELLYSYKTVEQDVDVDDVLYADENTEKTLSSNRVYVKKNNVTVAFAKFSQSLETVRDVDDIVYRKDDGEPMTQQEISEWYDSQLARVEGDVKKAIPSLINLLKNSFDVDEKYLNKTITEKDGTTYTPLQRLTQGAVKYGDGIISLKTFQQKYILPSLGQAKKTQNVKVSNQKRALDLLRFFQNTIPSAFLSYKDLQAQFGNTPDVRVTVDEAITRKWSPKIRISQNGVELNFRDNSNENKAAISRIMQRMEQLLTESSTADQFMESLKNEGFTFKGTVDTINPEEVLMSYFENRRFSRLDVPSNIMNAITLGSSTPLNAKVQYEHFRKTTRPVQHKVSEVKALGLVKDKFGNYLFSKLKYAKRFVEQEENSDVDSIYDTRILEIEQQTEEAKKILRGIKKIKDAFAELRQMYNIDEETFETTYLRNEDGRKKRLSRMLLANTLEDLKQKEIDKVEAEREAALAESVDAEEFEDRDTLPLTIAYAAASIQGSNRGPIVYIDPKTGEKHTMKNVTGTPGSVYLRLPSFFNPSRQATVIKLNPSKLDNRMAQILAELLVGINNGQFSKESLLSEAMGKLGYKTVSEMTVDQFLNQFIYMGTEAVKRNPSANNMDRLLYFDSEGKVLYGNTIDGQGNTATDVTALMNWLIDNKPRRIDREKLMRLGSKLDYDVKITDAAGNEIYSQSKDTPYVSYLIDEGVVTTDMDISEKSHIFEEPRVYVKYESRLNMASSSNDETTKGTAANAKSELKKEAVKKESSKSLDSALNAFKKKNKTIGQAAANISSQLVDTVTQEVESFFNGALSKLSEEDTDDLRFNIKHGKVDGMTTNLTGKHIEPNLVPTAGGTYELQELPIGVIDKIRKRLKSGKELVIKFVNSNGEPILLDGKEISYTIKGTPVKSTKEEVVETASSSKNIAKQQYDLAQMMQIASKNNMRIVQNADGSIEMIPISSQPVLNNTATEQSQESEDEGTESATGETNLAKKGIVVPTFSSKSSDKVDEVEGFEVASWGEVSELASDKKGEKPSFADALSRLGGERRKPQTKVEKTEGIDFDNFYSADLLKIMNELRETRNEALPNEFNRINSDTSLSEKDKLEQLNKVAKQMIMVYLLKVKKVSTQDAINTLNSIDNQKINSAAFNVFAPFKGIAEKFANDYIETEDYDAAVSRAEKILGKNFPLQIDTHIKKVWDNVRQAQIYVFGQCTSAGIRLVKMANNRILKGSLYHESFHNISLFVLSSSERKRMYRDAMEMYPELDGYTFQQIEEFLADRFAEFVEDSNLRKEGAYYSTNPIYKFFQKIFDTIRGLLNRLLKANITPKYTNLNKLFKDMYSGRYAYARATKDNIEEFNKIYTNFIAYKGFKIYGEEVADNAQQAYEIYRELLSRALMNSNVLTQYEGELLLNYDAVRQSIEGDLATYTTAMNSLIEEGSTDVDALLKYNNLIRVHLRILNNWDTWRNYVKQQVASKFKLEHSESDDPNAALESMLKTINNSDTIHASYARDQYNSMDMNVKMLLFSVTETDVLTSDGLSKYANPYQLFQEMGILCERCETVQQMMNKIANAAKRQNKNGSDVYSQIYSLLDKAEPHVKNSFFTNLVKFRNNFINTVYETVDTREDGSAIYNASVRSSNQEAINSRTTKQWKDSITQALINLSSQAPKTSMEKAEKSRKFKEPLKQAIDNTKLFTKEGAKKLADALLNTYGIAVDSDNLFKWLSQYKDSSDKSALKKAMTKQLIGSFKSEDLFDKELNTNKILKTMFDEKSVLRSLGEFISETSAPSIKTDSVRGAAGSKIHVISQYNFINRLFNVVIRTEDWVNKMSVNPYCFNSSWLNAFKPFADKNAVHPNIGIETYIATVADADYMNSREYMSISGIEDLMNKFVAVMNGRHIIPSLANKKTYYYLKGFADVGPAIRVAGVDRMYIADYIKQQFIGYLADEFLAIANAYKTRENFLKELNKRLGSNYTAETFSALSATEQEELFRKPGMDGLLSMLVNTYHYGNGSSEFIENADGTITRRVFRLDLTKGNGYKFRHFKKMMEGVKLSKEQIDKLTIASTTNVSDENAREQANQYALQLAQKYQDKIEEALLNNIALAINRFISDGIVSGEMISSLTGKPSMFSGMNLANQSIPVDAVLNSSVLNLPARTDNTLSSNELIRAIAQYAISGMIDTVEFEKLCSGDIAFFKDITAVNKRYSALTSTRAATADVGTIVNAYTEDRLHNSPTYRTMTFNTTLVSNKNLYEQYIKQALGANAVNKLFVVKDKKGEPKSINADVDYKKLLDKNGKFNKQALNGVLVQVYLQHRRDKLSYGVDDNGNPLSDEELAKRIVENVKDRYEGYLNTDPTDAQVWISSEMARQLKQREGKWNDATEACYDLLENYDRVDKLVKDHYYEFANTCSILGINVEEVLDKFNKLYKSGDSQKVAEYKGWIISKANNMDMTSYKYVHYGYSADRVDGLYAPIYDKMSLSPIFKIWSDNHAMRDLYDFMVENKVDMAKMETSVKSGGVPSFEMIDENGNFNKASLENSAFQDQYFSQLGKQLNTDPHHSTTSTLLTQFMKVAVMNIVPTNKYTINGKQISGAELLKVYQDILDELTVRGYENFRNKYGIENGKVNKAKFMRELQRMSETQDMPMETLEALTVDENGEYIVHPAALPNINWIQSRLIADMDRTIIKTVTPGQPLYQVSSMGYSNVQNIQKHKDVHLRMRNERGRMEVKLSINFFADILEEAGLKDASFDEQRAFILENKELFALSYRVPTQGLNSTLAIEIVDVLEPQRGAIIMFPAEITALTGSDFDIDKMFLARPNFYVDEATGKMKKLEYDVDKVMNDISSVDDKRLQNMLLDIFQTVLTSPQHMLDATTPLDVTIGPLKDIKDKIEAIVGAGSDDVSQDMWYLNPIFQTDQKIKNSGSDNGIGPMALNNVFRFFIQMANLKLKPNKYLTELGLTTMNRVYDRNGENILDSTSALINAHVDAVKDNYIGRMNVNGFTFDVTSFLISTGMGNDTYWFLGQPILKEVALNWMNYKNGVLGVKEEYRVGEQFMEMVIVDYHQKAGLSEEIKVTSWARPEEMTQEAMEASLRAERNEEWYAQQLRYLNTFKYIKNMAQNYRDALSGAQIDTGKYGISANEIIGFIQSHDDFVSEYNFAFENPEDLFSKTFLGQKYESGVVQMFQAFRDTIFEFTPVNVNTINEMAKQQGVYGRYGRNFIKRIGPRLKTVLFKPFFNAYVKERYPESAQPLNDLIVGENSVIAKFGEIKRKALILGEGTALFDVITVNKANEGSPRFLTIQSAVREDIMIKSNVQAAWAELFESQDEEIAQWAKDFAVYMFYLTGGTDSNAVGAVKTTLYDLVPPQHLATLEAGNTTYNEYVNMVMSNAAENENATFDQAAMEEALILAAKFDDDIVPLLKSSKTTTISYLDGDYKNIAVIRKGSQKLLNQNTGSYTKYIKIKSGNDISVYRLGNITVSVSKNGKAYVNPVYFKIQDIGYRNAANALYSVRADGEMNEQGRFVSLLNKPSLFNYTSLEDLQRAKIDKQNKEKARAEKSKLRGKKLAPGKAEQLYQVYADLSDKTTGYSIPAYNTIDFSQLADSNGVLPDGLNYTGFGIPYSYYAAIDAADTVYFLYTGPVTRATEGLLQYAKFKNKTFYTITPDDKSIPSSTGTATIIGTSLTSTDVESVISKLPKTLKFVASSEFNEKAGVADAPNYYLAEMIKNGQVNGTAYSVGIQLLSNTDMIQETQFEDGFNNIVENQIGVDASDAYRNRTKKNAELADVTLAFAIDFNTAGERRTKTSAGSKYQDVKLYVGTPENATDLTLDYNALDKVAKKYGSKKGLKINIAGNGLYTFSEKGIKQTNVDSAIKQALSYLRAKGLSISEVRSGGQSGVDEAGVKAADSLGIKWSILAPKGYLFRNGKNKTLSGREAFMKRFENLNFKGSNPDAVQQQLFDSNDFDDTARKHCKS